MDQIEKVLQEVATKLAQTGDKELLGKVNNCKKIVKAQSTGVLSKFQLNGKVALVTGGGQGIGEGFAIALAEAGCKVAVADFFLDRAENVATKIKETVGVPSIAIKVDVSNKSEVKTMVKKVLDTWGDLDIACNNAGIVMHSNSEETSEAEWARTMGVNLTGVFYCCQAEAQHMLKKGYGKIINTASMSATIVNHPQRQVAYNTSKAGVVHMSKSLATEWADRGVRVNCVSPGYVDTELNRADHLMAVRNIWLRDTPTGSLIKIEELVGAVLYLASPLSDACTGHDLIVDGGFTCW